MRSIPPADYVRLPRLAHPAAYIGVIRDVDSDLFRIAATDYPAALINAIIAEAERTFGIEVLSILETNDIAASKAELYEGHHAELSGEWLDLDPYQLTELRGSILQVNAHASFYLAAPKQPETRRATFVDQTRPRESRSASRRRLTGRYRNIGTLASSRYSGGAAYWNGDEAMPTAQKATSLWSSWKESIDDRFTDLMTNHPWLVLLILVIIVLICILSLDPEGPYGVSVR